MHSIQELEGICIEEWIKECGIHSEVQANNGRKNCRRGREKSYWMAQQYINWIEKNWEKKCNREYGGVCVVLGSCNFCLCIRRICFRRCTTTTHRVIENGLYQTLVLNIFFVRVRHCSIVPFPNNKSTTKKRNLEKEKKVCCAWKRLVRKDVQIVWNCIVPRIYFLDVCFSGCYSFTFEKDWKLSQRLNHISQHTYRSLLTR